MARIVDWPGRIAVCAGAGILLTLFLEFSGKHTHEGTRFYDATHAGAMALVIFGGAMLTLSWGQRRWREYGRSREKRRAIRLATLLAHADPVTAQVAEQGKRLDEIAGELRTTRMTYDGVVNALGTYLAEHGHEVAEDLQQTREMAVRPDLRLVAKDGERLREGKRDSA